jgi:hypothetical protein
VRSVKAQKFAETGRYLQMTAHRRGDGICNSVEDGRKAE